MGQTPGKLAAVAIPARPAQVVVVVERILDKLAAVAIPARPPQVVVVEERILDKLVAVAIPARPPQVVVVEERILDKLVAVVIPVLRRLAVEVAELIQVMQVAVVQDHTLGRVEEVVGRLLQAGAAVDRTPETVAVDIRGPRFQLPSQTTPRITLGAAEIG